MVLLSSRVLVVLAVLTLSFACGQEAPAEPPVGVDPDGGVDAGVDAGVQTLDGGADGGEVLPPALCSESAPSGTCPTGRVCREGGCIVDFDPKVPLTDVAAAVAEFDGLWRLYEERYGAFATKSLDWTALGEVHRARVAKAPTRFEAIWRYQQAVAVLQDGHTGIYSRDVCARTGGFGWGSSNIGACVTEVGGRLLVNRTGGQNPLGLEPGDEVLDIDGRDAPALLRDQDLQPRCLNIASTPAMARRQWVKSVMFRAASDRLIRVRRASGEEQVLDLPTPLAAQHWVPCDEPVRRGLVTEHGAGVVSAVLEGEILYVHLPVFGGYDAQGNLVAPPAVAALREAFSLAQGKSGVVLDLRDNPGGWPQVYLAIASFLYAQPTLLFTCQTRQGPSPDDFSASWEMWAQPDAQLQYGGLLAVLTNASTFSAGDFTSGFLQATGRARSFGHPSGGGFGSGNGAAWSADLTAAYNDLLCRDLKGELLEGNPPPVDVAVSWTPQALVEGRDPVVDAAVAWLVSPSP